MSSRTPNRTGRSRNTTTSNGNGKVTGNASAARIAPWRIWLFSAGTVVLLVTAGIYVAYAAHRHTTQLAASPAPKASLSLTGAPDLLYISTAIGAGYNHLAEVPAADPSATPSITPTSCQRSYSAGGTLVCLQQGSSLVGGEYANVYDVSSGSSSGSGTLHQLDSVQLQGVPSRARVSADGRMVSWTVFVSGDSYNGPEFSTRTGILDLRGDAVVSNLETFTAYVDGSPYHAVDINYWGVTFTSDDDHFYATMGSAGKTWLMRGDLKTKTLTSIVENVECPSLSPDGTKIVFKKRVATSLTNPWRLYVLNLATLQETPLAETRSVDDQAAWLGDDTVMYAVPQAQGPGDDIWEVPANGTGTPKLIIHNGYSPASVGN